MLYTLNSYTCQTLEKIASKVDSKGEKEDGENEENEEIEEEEYEDVSILSDHLKYIRSKVARSSKSVRLLLK